MHTQYIGWISPDLGVVSKFSEPEINEDISSPIKFTLYDKVWLEVVFLVLVGVRYVVVDFGRPSACCVLPSSKVAVWIF